MRVLFFGKVTSSIGHRMLDILEKYFYPENIEIYQSAFTLAASAKRKRLSEQIGLFCISDQDDLYNLILIKYFFEHLHPILILPSQDHKLIALGHKLNPSFLFFHETDDQLIESVIQMMDKNIKSKF